MAGLEVYVGTDKVEIEERKDHAHLSVNAEGAKTQCENRATERVN